MKATIQGLVLDGSDGTSPYTITGLKGWDDGVDMRREMVDRPAQHGEFELPGWLSGRLITIDGEIYTNGEIEQDDLVLQLSGLLAGGGSAPVVVQTSVHTLTAKVQRSGAPTITRDRWGLLATYQLQLWAPDPRKYGETQSFLSGESMCHYGNFPASPTLAVTATSTMAGYTIFGPDGKQFVVSQALPTGQTHTLDMRTGQLSLNGVLQLGAVSRADVWTIPPGGQVLHTLVPVSGAGVLAGTVRDTFI